MSTPFVRYLLSTAPAPAGRRQKSTRNGPRNKHLPKNKAFIGNPDLAVLKTENQNPTHVTPCIATLAQGLVREELVVVGPPPLARNKDLLQTENQRAYDHLCRLIVKAKKKIKDIDYKKEDRVSVHSEFYRAVEVEKEIYRVYTSGYIYYFRCLFFGNRSGTSSSFQMTPGHVGRILSSKDPKYAFLLMPGLTTFSGDLFTFFVHSTANV
jgi:hypothetical protein